MPLSTAKRGDFMANVFKGKVDIKNVRPNFSPVFVQYDHARLEIELFDNGRTYDLSDTDRVEFTHVRSDDLVIIHPGEIVTDGNKKIIRYKYRGSEMDLIGLVETSFAIFDADNQKVSSHSFFVEIRKDLRDEPFNPAEPNFGLLQKLIDDVERIKENGGGGGSGQGPKGDPGYTPIKGVDYFDGKDGKDGIDGAPGRDGVDGEKGDPFTYADFTQSQLEALRGPQGEQGETGPPGSNANVTSATITSALGYTPARQTHTHSYNDLTDKPTIPTLNNTVTSTSTMEAATANAVKIAYDRAEMAFIQADNGKNLIQNAVIGKGGAVPSEPSFEQLANAINGIPNGSKWAYGTYEFTKQLNITNLNFRPRAVLVRGTNATQTVYLLSTYITRSLGDELGYFNDSIMSGGYNTALNIYESPIIVSDNGFSVNLSQNIDFRGVWFAISFEY